MLKKQNKKPAIKKKVQKQVVFVVSCETESGDNCGPYVFAKKPTDRQLEAFWRNLLPDEFDVDDGPGRWNSLRFPSVEEATVHASVDEFDE